MEGEQSSGTVKFADISPNCLWQSCQSFGYPHQAYMYIIVNATITLKMLHTHTHPFNGPLSGTIQVSRYQKGKTNLDFTGARDSEWQWHQLGCMQVCTSLQTDNHASTQHSVFYRPDALSAAQPTASKQ